MLEQIDVNLFERVRSLCVFFATIWSGLLLVPLLRYCCCCLMQWQTHTARTFPFRRILISLIKEFTYRKNRRVCVSRNFRKTFYFFQKKPRFLKNHRDICSVPFTVLCCCLLFTCLFVSLFNCFCNLFGTCVWTATYTHFIRLNFMKHPFSRCSMSKIAQSNMIKKKLTNYGIWQTLFFIASHYFIQQHFFFSIFSRI